MVSQVELGSISCGTLRTVDLCAAFTSALEAIDPASAGRIRLDFRAEYLALERVGTGIGADSDLTEDEHEQAGYLLDALTDALDEWAPDGARFGAHEGDGSDFGFWPVDDV